MSSEVQRSLRRLWPGHFVRPLTHREDTDLPFFRPGSRPPASLLLDTTVYIDELQGRLPGEVETLLRVTPLWHTTISEGELAAACGVLDPTHRDTSKAITQILESLERRQDYRSVAPDRQVWREAGIACGILARIQSYRKEDRYRVLNDCLIYFTALKNGHTVLTRNTTDFDLLLQLAPTGRALFYRATANPIRS